MWTILLTHGLLLVSGSLVSGSVAVSLRDGLLGQDETSACGKKTQHESCSKAQTNSDWINIY